MSYDETSRVHRLANLLRESFIKIELFGGPSKPRHPERLSREAKSMYLSYPEAPVRRADRPDFHVRPCSAQDKARFYFGYFVSFFILLFAPRKARSPGFFVPGSSKLKVSIGGTLFYARPRTDDLDILAGSYEPLTVTWFRVKPGDVVVDVGAHIGRYGLLAAREAKKTVVIEPDPSNFSVLQANIMLNSFCNVIPIHVAVDQRKGRRLLYIADRGQTSTSSLEPGWTTSNRRAIEIECETLDNLTATLGLESIDWLKIDVEGHEVAVLEGAHSSLSKTKHLILEVAKGHEARCRVLTEEAGLDCVSIEEHRSGLECNWLLVRRG